MKASVAGWCRTNVEHLLTVAALLVLLGSVRPGEQRHGDRDVVLAVVSWLPLLVRSRRPAMVTAVAVALDVVRIVAAADGHPASATLPVATVVALYSLSNHRSAAVVWSWAAASAVLEFTMSVLAFRDSRAADLLYLNWSVVGAGIGQLVREHRERVALADQRAEDAERGSELEARRRVVAERLRIARELHDVLAHHLTVVNAQAGVAHFLLRTDLASAEKALAGITANTGAALDELRSTLGLLRSDPDTEDGDPGGHGDPDTGRDTAEADGRLPTPGLDQVPALVDSVRAAGTAVTVEVSGTPRPLGDIAQLTFYRIVQEALTNVGKHAPGRAARLGVDWTEETVTLTIVNARTGSAPGPGTGHGIVGMRERAAAAGGTLVCGPTAVGGYLVEATLPVPRTADPGVAPAAGPVPATAGPS